MIAHLIPVGCKTCRTVCRARHETELNLMQRFFRQDIAFKMGFQHAMPLMPINLRFKFYPAAGSIQAHHLHGRTATKAPRNAYFAAFRRISGNGHFRFHLSKPLFLPATIQLPCIIHNLHIAIQPPIIHFLTGVHQR